MLEARLRHLEVLGQNSSELAAVAAQQAQAARTAHDRSVTLLVALRATQLEQGARLDTLDANIGQHSRTLADHSSRLEAIETKLGDHDRRFDAIDRRFDAVDQRFDAIEGEIAGIKGTIGRVAVGMYTLEKLIRRIVPDDGETTD